MESCVIPGWDDSRIAFESGLGEHRRSAWRSEDARNQRARDEGVSASTCDQQCRRSAAPDPGILPWREGPEVDGSLGRIDRACRYLQCGTALSPATVRGLADRPYRPCTRRLAAAGAPGAIDPRHRCHNRAEG